ncbi:MAG: hypothetical protein N3B21_07300 [Clostridia bacterium]|nr:hypothetical protein [Clostridia bacterium]
MAEILTTELKSDLENIYKTIGDMLNLLEVTNFSSQNNEVNEAVDLIKLKLQDIEGTLQKDIYNCDYLITKFKTLYITDDGEDFYNDGYLH